MMIKVTSMQNKRERVVDVNADKKIAIRCKSTGRLNARADESGMYLFCRQCNGQHLLSWADLEQLKKEITTGSIEKVKYI